MPYETTMNVLKELPRVMPKKTKKMLKEKQLSCYSLSEHTFHDVDMGRFSLGADDFEEMLHTEFPSSLDFATPKGAKLLIELYKNGLLCMEKKTKPQEPSEAVKRYGEGLGGFSAGYKKAAYREEQEKRIHYLITHTEEIKESDFYMDGLLDKLLIHLCGFGNASTVIDGIEIHKVVSIHYSNSRKSHDFKVVIRWVGRDGTSHEILVKDSLYERNRRSDPDRNHGLGRE